MKLGYIGYGEAAYEMSCGLKEAGFNDIYAFDNMQNHPVFGKLILKRSKASGVVLEKSAKELVEKSDIIMVAVPTNYTIDVCKSIADYLRKGQLYVDVSASSPNIKKSIWELIVHKEIKFVDAAMMGVLPKFRHKVPILVCGNGAEIFKDIMTPYGMNITVIGDKPGDVSGIKLIRSLFMKGLAALTMETLEAAIKLGVEEVVIPGICKTLDECDFNKTMDRLSIGTVLHAKRRAEELLGCIEMLEDAGINNCMARAAMKKHETIANYNMNEIFKTENLQDCKQVIDMLISINNRRKE